MKYDVTTNHVKGDISGEKVSFSLDPQDPVMMQRLSSDVYSNPIKAIIRELSTNAYDSHQEIGQKKNFKVHLPTLNESYFEVEDFGSGMSKETLKKVYTQYGKSTRRESNDFVGSIGIGSKSPFSYVGAFEVRSNYEGMQTKCLCSKNSHGVPELTVISHTETSEPNGTKIHIPVKTGDIDRFHSEAKEVFFWFDKRPEINSLKFDSNFNTIKHQISGTKWKQIDETFFGVLMGNVFYPVNIYNASIKEKVPGLILEADLGELDFAISREELHYTKKTKDFIFSAIEVVKNEYTSKSQAKIHNCTNKYDAFKTFTALKKNLLKKDLMYKGCRLTNYGIYIGGMDAQAVSRWDHKSQKISHLNLTHLNSEARIFNADIHQGKIKAAREVLKKPNVDYVVLINEGDLFEKTFGVTLPKISQHYQKTSRGTGKTYNDPVLMYDFSGRGIPTNSYSLNWTNSLPAMPAEKVYCHIDKYKIQGAEYDMHTYRMFAKHLGINMPPIFGVKTRELDNWRKDPTCIHIDDFIEREAQSFKDTEKIVLHSLISSVPVEINWFINHIYDPALMFGAKNVAYINLYKNINYNYNFLHYINNHLNKATVKRVRNEFSSIISDMKLKITPKHQVIYDHRINNHNSQKTILL